MSLSVDLNDDVENLKWSSTYSVVGNIAYPGSNIENLDEILRYVKVLETICECHIPNKEFIKKLRKILCVNWSELIDTTN